MDFIVTLIVICLSNLSFVSAQVIFLEPQWESSIDKTRTLSTLERSSKAQHTRGLGLLDMEEACYALADPTSTEVPSTSIPLSTESTTSLTTEPTTTDLPTKEPSFFKLQLQVECNEKQNVSGVEIEWKYSINNKRQYYYTKPLCIDRNGHYVLRKCTNGELEKPEPNCNTLQRSDYACMDGLELHSNTSIFCYKKSEKMTSFQDQYSCPYKHMDATDNTNYYSILSEMFSVWMPYHRQDMQENSIGYFVPDGIQGSVFNPWNTTADTLKDKCLSMTKGNLSADCDKQCYHACVYRAIPLDAEEERTAGSKEANLCETLCGQHTSCRVSWEKGGMICICPKTLRLSSDCTPAVYPTATIGCALGLEVNEYGALIWTSTNQAVRNTFWSVDNLQVTLGRYVVPSETGWTTSDKAECMMCKLTFNDYNTGTAFELGYNSTKMEAVIFLDNELAVFSAVDPINPKERYIFKCYMEATNKVVNIKDLTFPGLWQCEAIDIMDTSKKFYTNTLQLDFGRYIFVIQLVEEIKTIETALNLIFHDYSSPLLIQYLVVSNKKATWIEWLYKFDVDLANDKDYRQKYEDLTKELSDSKWAALKPHAYNLLYCGAFTSIQQGHTLNWPAAEVDNKSNTDCFDQYNRPISIKCEGNFTLGARFTEVPECYSFAQNFTEELEDLENSTAPPEEILTNLTTVLQSNDNFTSKQFDMTANILEKLREKGNVTDIVNVISEMMLKSPSALHDSQREVNATDRVLYSLDVALKSKQIVGSHDIIDSADVRTVFIDRDSSIFTGAAYLNSREEPYLLLKRNLTISEILKTDRLESAVYINNFSGSGLISITMFNSSVLFNEKESSEYKTFNRVFGVLLPQNTKDIDIMLVFPNANTTNCAYWMYGNSNYGKWKVNYNNLVKDNFTVCLYNHATHFGQLIMLTNPLDPISDMILSTMTAIECGLSTLGLCVVLVTAVLFPTWRYKKERLLHYCTVLLLQTILLFVNSNVKMGATACIIAGAVLHFTVLSQFCWMVVVAVHQYRTLIIVYQTKKSFWESKHVMWFTYGAPLLIITTALAVNVDDYIQGIHLNMNICYPSGNVLIFSLILPTVCMASANGCMFFGMVYKLTCSKRARKSAKPAGLENNWLGRNQDKIRTLSLMVFTLGITWWLGFAALLLNSGALLFLFSITTGLQGVIIFLINIVAKPDVRLMYIRKYKIYRM